MSNLVSRILDNLATRLMFMIYIFFIAVTIFFIGTSYYHELDMQKQRQYDKLKGIVAVVAASIDGDQHELMMANYNQELESNKLIADSIYALINNQLFEAQSETDLTSPIYTLVQDEKNQSFYYGVRSDQFMDVNNEYIRVPDLLIANYEVGGVLPVYETENGTWISAFHPIKKQSGAVVGLLEADIEFSAFMTEVKKEYLQRLLVLLSIMILIFLVFIIYARKILKSEVLKNHQLADQRRIIELKNKDITDSLHYALKIQNKMLPSNKAFEQTFAEHFIMYQPKDIVAGDFYWMKEIEGEVYVAVADCTGHGVPGAILSIICAGLLDKVVCQMRVKCCAEILNTVRDQVIDYLAKGDYSLKDGMDIALCKINLKTNQLSYAGAYNPIYIFRNKQLIISVPTKQPIGDFYELRSFQASHYDLQPNDIVYLFTDGYPDQFGGENNKKFKLKNFKSLITSLGVLDMEMQKEQIEKVFNDWKGEKEQIDDVCVIGLKI